MLLYFWAVWCGPCIATFPHLREWQEKYADRGLVVIGLTQYYGYTWDEDAKRASRSEEKVEGEQEQEMLTKFAEHHQLKHRFAIQSDDTLGEYYKVSGIRTWCSSIGRAKSACSASAAASRTPKTSKAPSKRCWTKALPAAIEKTSSKREF